MPAKYAVGVVSALTKFIPYRVKLAWPVIGVFSCTSDITGESKENISGFVPTIVKMVTATALLAALAVMHLTSVLDVH
jgi:hypothetical protein